ncbi:MAG: ECF transporter S component [Clostridia bacterium]|nr:ECF transporter S component [Clostridia bacterium]
MTKHTTASAVFRSGDDVLRLTTAAVATALVFLFTFLIKVPTALGYVHLGDAFVLLYAAVSGDPLALLVGALGEGLADVAGGYFQYAPATVLIKALIALPVFLNARKERSEHRDAEHGHRILTARTFLWSLVSIPVTLGGYFLTDYLLSGAYAFAALWTNGVQAVGSILVFAVLAIAFEKSRLEQRLR